MVDFLRGDAEAREALLSKDCEIITAVTRGRKTGGPTTPAEFEAFRAGLKAWTDGRSFDQIEIALGVAPGAVGNCARARDLVLKLAIRRLYMLFVALAELARVRAAAAGLPPPAPALLEILPIAIRKGF